MPDKALLIDPAEREVRTVVIGVILFAIAIAIITFGFSVITDS